MDKTIRAAILSGFLRLDVVRAIDDIIARIRASLVTASCDLCGGQIDRRAPKMLIAHMLAQRVNVARHWGFCSDLCRETWFSAGASVDLHPIADLDEEDPIPFRPDDGVVHVSIIHDDGPTGAAMGAPVGVAILNPIDGHPVFMVKHGRVAMYARFASPADVNLWWRAPQTITTGTLEVIDWRVAA